MSANLVIDLCADLNAVERNMRRTTLQEVRQAQKKGITIREGGPADADLFFGLMRESCRRQKGAAPNPSTAALVEAMWHSLSPNGHLRITFAEFAGEAIAGLLCIRFGRRCTFWKKGWSGQHADKRPNQLLYYEAIQWALANGCTSCDFAAISRPTARCILDGQPVPAGATRSRDFFNLGFGGTPVILPESRLYIPNRALRAVYETLKCRSSTAA